MIPQSPHTQSQQLLHSNPRLHRHQQDDIDFKRYLFLIMENWYWFIISVMVGVVSAYLVNRYTIKEYKVSAALLIESQSNQTNSFLSGNYQGNDMFSGFWLYPDMKMVENQMIVLQSYSQVNTTIHSVDFEVSYYKDEVTGRREIYNDAPFVVLFDSTMAQPLGALFRVNIRENGKVFLKAEVPGEKVDEYDYLKQKITGSGPAIDFDREVSFGELIESNSYSFTLQQREGKNLSEGTWYFRFNNYADLVSEWRGKIGRASCRERV